MSGAPVWPGAKCSASLPFGVTSVVPGTGSGPRGCGSQTSGVRRGRASSACRSRGPRATPAPVVGDEHRAGTGERVPRLVREVAGRAGGPAPVQPQQGPAGAAHADLLGRRAAQAEVDDAHARPGQQVAELGAPRVRGQRGDEHDVPAVGGREQRGEAGAAGPCVLDGLVDHRHRRVRAEPVDRADQVAVEQGVPDDDERPAGHACTAAPAGSSG